MARINVAKTYKIYIGGKFPRTESGRYYNPEIKGNSLGNICLSSLPIAQSANSKYSSEGISHPN